MFQAGYALVAGERGRVTLLGGLGGGSLGVSLRQRGVEGSFDSVVQRPSGVLSLSSGGWLVQVGIRAEARIGRGFLMGVIGGYGLPLGWEPLGLEDGSPLAGAPRASLGGFSLRLFFGGGALPWRGRAAEGRRDGS